MKNKIRVITVYILVLGDLFFTGCSIFSPTQAGITPDVSITEPVSGDTIKTASVIIKAVIINDADVIKVKFFDNNFFLGEVSCSPYNYEWQTAFVSNGEHSIKAEAVSASGDKGTSPLVTVYVSKTGMFDWGNNDSPTTDNLNDLFVFDEKNIWVCGDDGTILFFDGFVWSSSSISNKNLSSIEFTSISSGWSVGGNTLFGYSNSSWSEVYTFPSMKEDFISVCMFGDTLGWVGDSEGKIFQFINDSLEQYVSLSVSPITDIVAISPDNVYACCGNTIFYFDGFDWWLDTTFVNDKVNTLFAIDSQNIWGGGTALFHFDGQGWSMFDLPFSSSQNCEIKSMFFTDDNKGIACGVNGNGGFIISFNGSEWKEESIQKNVPLKGICRFSTGEGWAVGNSGVILHSQSDGNN
ncbi:MAG: hypothetical protein B5M53_01215 [Candidatus Cloacimonas sp. 4484_209]|nr:MAG: hypothetical protein B5M53_01215 [Candidatus Cloacimonas sp. 4484_209]